MAEPDTQQRAAQRPDNISGETGVPGPRQAQLATLSKTLNAAPPVQRLEALAPPTGIDRTHLPHQLKTGIEAMSGLSMDGVKVHYNSSKPAQLNAHAYAQGSDIHLAPGQEQHLPHEAWHVVQQAQGRVKPTMQMKSGTPINDDEGLEHEADIMGARAMQPGPSSAGTSDTAQARSVTGGSVGVLQRELATDAEILGKKSGTFKWKSFEGTRVEGNLGTASELGRGAKLDTGKVVQTAVTWGAIDTQSGEGTSVSATIGPDHNLGSKPSAKNAKARVTAFGLLSNESYIAGHLMNEKLGGPGNEGRNLTAISGSANTLQSSNIEKFVRDPVNEHGAWMKFDLGVAYADDSKVMASNTPTLIAALKTKAEGLTATPIPTTMNSLVSVRYASDLAASWYHLDVDGGIATKPVANTVSISSPLATVPSAKSVARKTGGAASGKAAAKTVILAEELVLTKSDLLKHVVTSRAPLALRIQQLKDNYELLSDEHDDLLLAQQTLGEEAKQLGRQAGGYYAFMQTLQGHNLAGNYRLPDMIDWPPYTDAYKEGLTEGREAGELYVRGYNEGLDQGWGDLEKAYTSQQPSYKEGYDRGHADGLQRGDYQAGKKYVFNGISLLLNINERNLNSFSHQKGLTTIELTGNSFAQPNQPKWYQVKVVTAEGEGLRNELGLIAWMKRRWLNKGF
jgi:hypothetical protein